MSDNKKLYRYTWTGLGMVPDPSDAPMWYVRGPDALIRLAELVTERDEAQAKLVLLRDGAVKEVVAKCDKLERERDEAREKIEQLEDKIETLHHTVKTYASVMKRCGRCHGEALDA